VLAAVALRQHPGRMDSGMNPISGAVSRRTPETEAKAKRTGANDEEAEEPTWPELAALQREMDQRPADAPDPVDAGNRVGPALLELPPTVTNAHLPAAELKPSRPGEAAAGCPYVVRLREFVLGSITADTEEGRYISQHQDCPRCRRWLDFFVRDTATA
jgi:hypothetical protein